MHQFFPILFIFFPFLAESAGGAFQARCGLGYEEATSQLKAVSNFLDTLEQTYNSQIADPYKAALYPRLDTYLVWCLLGSACPRLVEEHNQLQAKLATIPLHTEECKDIVLFYGSPDVEMCCFLGVMLRAMAYGIKLGGYSAPLELPLKIASEARRLLFEQQHFGMTPQYGGLLVELLKVNDLLMPEQQVANDVVVTLLGRTLIDLHILVMLAIHVPYPEVKADIRLPNFLEKVIDKRKDSIIINSRTYFFRGTHVCFLLKAWRVLCSYIPNAKDRKKYFDENTSAIDNYMKLQLIIMRIPKRISTMELMNIACAYDCMYYYAKICNIEKEFSKLRDVIVDIIFSDIS